MIVSHAHRFIFFHNPKCAGTSLRVALDSYHDDEFKFWGIYKAPFFRNEIDHTHLRLWEMQALFPRLIEAAATYRSALLVRNPYRRFVSAVDEHFKKFQPSVPLETMPPEQQTQTVELFLEKVLTIERITCNWRFIHFSPQLWFIRLGDRQIPRAIIPIDGAPFLPRVFESLGIPPLEVRPENPSRLNLLHVLQSPKVANFVRGFYAQDFEFFAPDPALTNLPS